MDDYMICNTVPIYPEAPVSPELFKRYTAQILKAIAEKQAEKKYLIVDKRNKEIKVYLEEQKGECSNPDIEIVSVDVTDGFVFGNATALAKVIKGEKPIPSGMDANLEVYSVEDLLEVDKKIVYIGGNAEKKGVFTFAKKIKPRNIWSQCNSDKEFKGMYFGYPMGVFVSADQLDDEVELTTDTILIFDESDCILHSLVAIAQRYEKECCGRCVFGHEGTSQIHMILSDMAQRKGKSSDIELLMDLCSVMQKQSLCDIGMVAANTVVTAFNNFREEIEGHIHKKTCKAAVCSKFITYHILADKCTGCNECQDACDDEAILGKKRFVHVIDQEECVQCGACIDACEEGAIVKAGPVKPKGPKSPIPCKR